MPAGHVSKVAGQGDMANVEHDPEVYVAEQKARRSLDQFITRYRNPQVGDKAFGVRGRFATSKGNEFMWVVVDSYANSEFQGHLLDEPVMLDKHKGDEVSVKRDDVMDWIYLHDGKQVGGYTIQALQGRPQ